MNADPRKLPDHEYKFGEVTDDEIEAAFWWEYLREDERLRTEPGPANDEESLLTVGSRWDVAQYFARGAAASAFRAKKAWRDLSDNLRGGLWRNLPAARIPVCVNDPSSSVRALYRGNLGFKELQVWVDWTFTDRQIAQAFERDLARYRPWGRWKPHRKARKPEGGSREPSVIHPLCPDFRAALSWLGRLRCAKSCNGNLEEMRKVYGLPNNAEAADWRKEAARATHVVMWLATGDPTHLETLPKAKSRKQRLPAEAAALLAPDQLSPGKKEKKITFIIGHGRVICKADGFTDEATGKAAVRDFTDALIGRSKIARKRK